MKKLKFRKSEKYEYPCWMASAPYGEYWVEWINDIAWMATYYYGGKKAWGGTVRTLDFSSRDRAAGFLDAQDACQRHFESEVAQYV